MFNRNRIMKGSLSARDIRIISRQTRRKHEKENWQSKKVLYLTQDPNHVVFVCKTGMPLHDESHKKKNWLIETWKFLPDQETWMPWGAAQQSHKEIKQLQKSEKIVAATESDEALLTLRGLFDMVNARREAEERNKERLQKELRMGPWQPPVQNEGLEEIIEEAEDIQELEQY